MHFFQLCSQAECQLQQAGTHPPTLIASFETLRTPVQRTFPALPTTAGPRRQFLFTQGQLLAQDYPDLRLLQIWFITEAWSRVLDQPASSPTPAHQEGLVVFAFNMTMPSLPYQVYLRPFHRNAQKKVTGFSDLVDTNEERILGALLYPFLAGFIAHAFQNYKHIHRRLMQIQARMDLGLHRLG